MKINNPQSGRLLVTIILLCAVSAVAGIVVMNSLRKVQHAERELEAQQAKMKQVQASQLEQEIAARSASAKNEQEKVMAELKVMESNLRQLQQEARNTKASADRLLTGELGGKLALKPELLQRAQFLFSSKLKELPADETFSQQLEATKRIQISLERAGVTYLPDDELKAKVQSQAVQAKATSNEVDAINLSVKSLEDEARLVEVPKGAALPTLGQAIENAQKAQAALVNQQHAALKKQAEDIAAAIAGKVQHEQIISTAQNAADITTAAIQNDRLLAEQRIRDEQNKARLQALDQEEKRKRAQEEAAHQVRLAKAKQPEVLTKLRPFVSAGYWQPGATTATGMTKGPISLAKLRQSGALVNDDTGLRALAKIGTYRNNDRPKWEASYHSNAWNKPGSPLREELIKRQALLNELGNELGELGLLAP